MWADLANYGSTEIFCNLLKYATFEEVFSCFCGQNNYEIRVSVHYSVCNKKIQMNNIRLRTRPFLTFPCFHRQNKYKTKVSAHMFSRLDKIASVVLFVEYRMNAGKAGKFKSSL